MVVSYASPAAAAALPHIKGPAWDPIQCSSQDGEYSTIDSHIIAKCTDTTPPSLYPRFARAVISQGESLMNPVPWSALKVVFPVTQQEDDLLFPDRDRSALKVVLKLWASAVLLLRSDRLGATLQGSHWFDLICSWPLVWHEWAPWRFSCCHANDPGTLNLRWMRAAWVMDEQFSSNLV